MSDVNKDLRDKLRTLVVVRPVTVVAGAIPCDPVTVYRVLNGTTKRPSLAFRAGVDRLAREESDGVSKSPG